jgi:hypothetical protein
MSQHNTIHCPSCHTLLAKNYCPACGEKKHSDHDLTVKHFVEESLEGFTHFDGKFFRTVKLILFHPGQLTQYFEAGKRVPYMKPFQLFLVSNLLFFLVAHGPNLFATPLSSFYNYSDYTRYGTKTAIDFKVGEMALKNSGNKTAASKKVATIELAKMFNEKMVTQSKLFIILFIPLLALGFAVFYYRKKSFMALHLVFATHFFSFILLYFIIYFFLVEIPQFYFFKGGNNNIYDNIFGFSSLLVFIAYLFFAIKRFYHSRVVWNIISSVFIAGFFLVILNAYRLFLFYKIIHSIS